MACVHATCTTCGHEKRVTRSGSESSESRSTLQTPAETSCPLCRILIIVIAIYDCLNLNKPPEKPGRDQLPTRTLPRRVVRVDRRASAP